MTMNMIITKSITNGIQMLLNRLQ